MYIGVIFDILVALFAVYGLYAALRMLMEVVFSPRSYPTAILIYNEEELDELDVMLDEARRANRNLTENKVIVILDRSLADKKSVKETLFKYGVGEVYAILNGENEQR